MGRELDWIYPAIVIAMTTALLAIILKLITGYPGQPSGMTSLTAAVTIIMVTGLVRFLRHLFRLWREGESHPLQQVSASFRPALMSMTPIIAGVAIIGAFLYSTTFLKSMIPAVVPFWADPLFAATDRAIFVDPQAIAVALAPALTAIGFFYGLWHAAHLGGILWVLHWRSAGKARHILSFMLTWSIGMLLAYIFSSMGPIFTGQYDPAVAPETVQRAAAFLWANYHGEGALLGGGISAFPSMHVAIAAWLAIVLKDRNLTWLGLAYLVGVFAGSVVLGWHYVIDGVVGIAIAACANRIAMQWTNRGAQQGQSSPLAVATPN